MNILKDKDGEKQGGWGGGRDRERIIHKIIALNTLAVEKEREIEIGTKTENNRQPH